MKEKKGLFILLVLILVFLLFLSLPGETKRTLLVGAYDNPPLVFRDRDGRVRGMYPEVLEHIAQREGWGIEYIFLPFSSLLSHLREGRLDLLLSVVYTEERAKYLDFNHQTFLVNWGEVYTSPASFSVSSLSDLASKKIAVGKDDVYGEELKRLLHNLQIDAQFWETEDYRGVFTAVKEGMADAGVVSRLYGGQFAKTAGLAATPIVFLPTELRFAVPRGKNREIIDTIDEHLLVLKVESNSIYYQSLNYWLSIKEEEWHLPSWIKWSLIIVSVAFSLTLFLSYFLRREVRRQTKELVEKSEALAQEIKERKALEEELRFNLDFQRLTTNISLRFVIDSSWEQSVKSFLEETRRFARASEVVFVGREEGYLKRAGEIEKIPIAEEMTHWIEQLDRKGPLWIEEKSFPEKYWRKKEREDIKFILSFPLEAGNRALGFLELVWKEGENVDKSWIKERFSLFQTFPYLLSNALEREEMRRELQRERDWLETILRSITDGVIVTDVKGLVRFMNREAEALTGWSLSEAQGEKLEEIFSLRKNNNGNLIENLVEKILKKEEGEKVFQLKPREGGEIIVTCSGAPIRGRETWGAVLVFRDITERYQMAEELQKSERRYRLLFNQMLDGFALLEEVYSEDGSIWDFVFLEVNPAFEHITGFSREELVGLTLQMVFPSLATAHQEILQQIAEKEETTAAEACLPLGDKYLEVVAFSSSPGQVAIICRDITEKKKKEEEIRYLSFHDALTSLYNRAFWEEELQRLDDGRHLPLSLIFLDVNGLKEINDTLGHKEGDRLLQEMAQVLRKSTREGDIVARWGGDEFVILLPQTPENSAREIAKRIRENCKQAQRECHLLLSFSWGVATKEERTEDMREIFRQAEEEAYRQKLSTRKDFLHSLIPTLVHQFYKKGKNRERQQRVEELAQKIGERWGWEKEKRKKLHFLSLLWMWRRVLLSEYLRGDDYSSLQEELVKIYPEFEKQPPLSRAEWNSLFSEILSGERNGKEKIGEKEREISLMVYLLKIVETYVLLVEDRGLTPEEAIQEIRREAGGHFDPKLVEILEEVVREK